MSNIRKYFSSSAEDALEKYKTYKNIDPFPCIVPSLLSSSQIQAYIAKTGMVFPYFPDTKNERLTQASLTMTIGQEVLYWDQDEKRQYGNKDSLKKGDEIIIRPNSITYLRPTERVNLPDYIAARFNLRIIHVHRGLLLGTGPLLDPGFKGYPMIPVHNLTANEYHVQVGDEFIGVEFTKIDIGPEGLDGTEEGVDFPFKYIENKGKTSNFSFTQYINKNVPQRKVKSSLSGVIDKANKTVKESESSRKRITYVSIIGAVIALCAAIYGGYQLIISALDTINRAGDKIDIERNDFVSIQKYQDELDIIKLKIRYIEEELKTNNKKTTNIDSNIKHDVKVNFIRPENATKTH